MELLNVNKIDQDLNKLLLEKVDNKLKEIFDDSNTLLHDNIYEKLDSIIDNIINKKINDKLELIINNIIEKNIKNQIDKKSYQNDDMNPNIKIILDSIINKYEEYNYLHTNKSINCDLKQFKDLFISVIIKLKNNDTEHYTSNKDKYDNLIKLINESTYYKLGNIVNYIVNHGNYFHNNIQKFNISCKYIEAYIIEESFSTVVIN